MIRRKNSNMSRKYSKTFSLKRLRKTPYLRKQGMSEQGSSNGDIEKDFQSTGRTGRRNALADVLGPHKEISTSDLPLKLEKLTTNDVSENSDSDSKKNNCTAENDKEGCSTNSSTSSS